MSHPQDTAEYSLRKVINHELGHALGLFHKEGKDELMNPLAKRGAEVPSEADATLAAYVLANSKDNRGSCGVSFTPVNVQEAGEVYRTSVQKQPSSDRGTCNHSGEFVSSFSYSDDGGKSNESDKPNSWKVGAEIHYSVDCNGRITFNKAQYPD